MKLEFSNGLTVPVAVEANRLVIKDNFGQPIFLAIEYDRNTIATYKAKPGENPEFDRMLRELGVGQPSTISEIQI